MDTMRSKIFLFVFNFLPFAFFAQDFQQTQDLRQDLEYFNQQKDIYQKWLDNSGIGSVLKVKELDVQEKQLTLFLKFEYTNIDSIVQAWTTIKREFEKENSIRLEQQLFYKLANLMEVRQSLVRVAIFDTYDLRKEPLFLRGIYFDAGMVKVQESNPKSKIEEIQITLDQHTKRKKLSVASFKETFTKAYVFEKLTKFAEPHFQRKTCEGRKPEIRIIENVDVLRFRATDLCREVLTDAANPTLARILNNFGLGVNWVKREKLDILIAYEELPKGFKLTITIDGKYGSGLYNQVGRGGYYSMEGDFDEYLEDYADAFKELVREAILN